MYYRVTGWKSGCDFQGTDHRFVARGDDEVGEYVQYRNRAEIISQSSENDCNYIEIAVVRASEIAAFRQSDKTSNLNMSTWALGYYDQ